MMQQLIKRRLFWLLTILAIVLVFGFISINNKINKFYTVSDKSSQNESAFQTQYEDRLKKNVSEILNRIVGKKNYQLSAHVQLNQIIEEIEQVQLEPQKVYQSYIQKKQQPTLLKSPGLLTAKGVKSLPGFPASTQYGIAPNVPVSRKAFAHVVTLAYKLRNVKKVSISDVSVTDPYYNDIQIVIANKILTLQGNKFNPQRLMDKTEIVTALVRLNNLKLDRAKLKAMKIPYKDISSEHWAGDSIKSAYFNKIIEPSTNFLPQSSMNVAELINMLLLTPKIKDKTALNTLLSAKNITQTKILKKTSKSKTIEHANEVIYYNQVISKRKTPNIKISRLVISVLLDEDRFEKCGMDLALLRSLIKNTAGIDDRRNDLLLINLISFSDFGFIPSMIRQINNSRFKWFLIVGLTIIFLALGYLIVIYSVKGFKKLKTFIIEGKLKTQKNRENAEIQVAEAEYSKEKSAIVDFARSKPHEIARIFSSWIETS